MRRLYLNDGSLTAYTVYVGNEGSGSFIQSGGSNTVGGSEGDADLSLGISAGGSGAYTLDGGSLSVDGNEYMGDSGTRHLHPDRWHQQRLVPLLWAAPAGASGTYNLSGDSSILAVSGGVYIGDAGSGSFTQSGGTNTVVRRRRILSLGTSDTGSGTYNLSGGSLAAGNEYIGDSGSGSFHPERRHPHMVYGTAAASSWAQTPPAAAPIA